MKTARFLKIYSDFHGEAIDNIKQITKSSFTGKELKEFCDFVIKENSKSPTAKKCKCGKENCICYTR